MNDKDLNECPFCYENEDLHIDYFNSAFNHVTKYFVYCGLCLARGSSELNVEDAQIMWNKVGNSRDKHDNP